MKIAVIPWNEAYQGNRMFDVNNKKLNRDHLMTPYSHMKREFEAHGDEFNTIDLYGNLSEVDYFLFFDFFPNWIIRLANLGLDGRMIYCNAEPEVVNPLNSQEGYEKVKKYFPYIMTWNKDLIDDRRIYKRIIPYYFEERPGAMPFAQKKLLTNISGNKTSDNPKELYSERERLITFFEKNYNSQFDLYGTGWDKKKHPSYRGMPENKYEVYHRYRFALSLENTKDVKGYVTEKIYDCFVSGIVPVYQGAEDILDYVPKECFIDYSQFGTMQELADFLVRMPEEEYLSYQEAIKTFLKTDIADRLDGAEYAKNIYHVIDKSACADFRINKKDKMHLIIREQKSGVKRAVKSAAVSIYHKISRRS